MNVVNIENARRSGRHGESWDRVPLIDQPATLKGWPWWVMLAGVVAVVAWMVS